MHSDTGTAATQPSHFVADPVGARYESDDLARYSPDSVTAAPRSIERSGHIVVGVDGSEPSLRALAKSVGLARSLNTNVNIITTWRYFTEYNNIGVTDWSPQADAQEILGDACRRQFGDIVPEWVSFDSAEGDPAQRLIDASADAEMLVVGSRGHGGVVGLLLGSVSSSCAEKAHCPVLVVH